METLHTERSAPSSTVPHWLVLADISPATVGVYCALGMHANDQGVAKVQLTALAHLCGFSRSDKVRRHIRILQRIGAVVEIQAPGRRPAQYRIVTDPPTEHAGPRTLAEWTESRRLVVVA